MAAGFAELAPAPPIGFVSYVHEDAEDGDLLRNFLELLATRLAASSGRRADDVLFVDRSSIVIGQTWNPVLTAALARARVFVAIYTPRYFNKAEGRCFCGREFAAFWARSRPEGVQSNIFPVLWRVPPPTYSTFPPEAVASIQYTLNNARANPGWLALYRSEGLEHVYLRRGRKAYDNLVLDIVNQILGLANDAPAELTEPPILDETQCAFHEDEQVMSVPLAGPSRLSAERGPHVVELIYVTNGPDDSPPSLGGVWLSKLIFSPDVQTHITQWPLSSDVEVLAATLVQASANGQIPLVVLSAEIQAATARELADRLVSVAGWTGAVVAPAALDLPSGTNAVRVLKAPDEASQLAMAVPGLIADIRRHLTLAANVYQPGVGPGPDRIPRL